MTVRDTVLEVLVKQLGEQNKFIQQKQKRNVWDCKLFQDYVSYRCTSTKGLVQLLQHPALDFGLNVGFEFDSGFFLFAKIHIINKK